MITRGKKSLLFLVCVTTTLVLIAVHISAVVQLPGMYGLAALHMLVANILVPFYVFVVHEALYTVSGPIDL